MTDGLKGEISTLFKEKNAILCREVDNNLEDAKADFHNHIKGLRTEMEVGVRERQALEHKVELLTKYPPCTGTTSPGPPGTCHG